MMDKRYVVTTTGSADYPYAAWDGRHRLEVTAYRTLADASDAVQDMNDEYNADLTFAQG